MKNKKIILGLGTITALGAMSVGFIACVKEKEVKKIVDEAGYSKLTEDQVMKIVDKIVQDNKLTEEQLKKLIEENKDSKLLAELFVKTNMPAVQEAVTKDLKEKLAKPIAKDSKIQYSDIGHFVEGKKEKDLIDVINKSLEAEGWIVALSDTEEKQAKTKDLEKSAAKNGVNEKKLYTLKKTILGVEIKTKDPITFKYSLGKFDLSQIPQGVLKGEVNSLDNAISQLNKLDQFKNNQITTNDVEQTDFTAASLQADGKIKISAKSDSKKFEKDITLTIPQYIGLESFITTKALGQLDRTINPTEADIIAELKKQNSNKEEIKIDNLTIENITSTGAKVKGRGIYKGEVDVTFQLKKELNTLITNINLGEFPSTPDESAIIKKLKELHNNNLEIKTENLTIESITSAGAKVKGKGIYKGEVDVTFKIATTTPS